MVTQITKAWVYTQLAWSWGPKPYVSDVPVHLDEAVGRRGPSRRGHPLAVGHLVEYFGTSLTFMQRSPSSRAAAAYPDLGTPAELEGPQLNAQLAY